MFELSSVPPNIGNYLAGFADGEGSFNVPFRKRKDYKNPWKISLCFNISQKEASILLLFQKYLQCGTIRQRFDGVSYFEVNDLKSIVGNVIPFFKEFGFLSDKKKRDFDKFCQIAEIIQQGLHLQLAGVRQILELRSDMNDGGKRTYTIEEILGTFENPQRLYAGLSSMER